MFRPPTDPRYRPDPVEPTWRRITAGYGLIAAVFLSLWLHSQPLLGALAITGAAVLIALGRRVRRLQQCLRECGAITVTFGERARITVSRPTTEQA